MDDPFYVFLVNVAKCNFVARGQWSKVRYVLGVSRISNPKLIAQKSNIVTFRLARR